jgi:hypothetical protein
MHHHHVTLHLVRLQHAALRLISQRLQHPPSWAPPLASRTPERLPTRQLHHRRQPWRQTQPRVAALQAWLARLQELLVYASVQRRRLLWP